MVGDRVREATRQAPQADEHAEADSPHGARAFGSGHKRQPHATRADVHQGVDGDTAGVKLLFFKPPDGAVDEGGADGALGPDPQDRVGRARGREDKRDKRKQRENQNKKTRFPFIC